MKRDAFRLMKSGASPERLMTLAAKQLREWQWIATYSTHVLDLAVMNGHDPTGTLAKVIAELERITKDTPVLKPQPDTVDPAIFRSEEA